MSNLACVELLDDDMEMLSDNGSQCQSQSEELELGDAESDENPLCELPSGDEGYDPAGKVVVRSPLLLHQQLISEIPVAVQRFWLRRSTRRRILKCLAEECVQFSSVVRRRSAEIRAAAAKKRLELLRSGNAEGYASMLAATKESRLKEVLDETDRILSELKPAVATTDSKVEQPASIQQGKMMPHQLRGLKWLVNLTDNGMSGILADDMGLGKTIQTLALLAFLKEHRNRSGPHLVVTPLSTVAHWSDEVIQWLPSLQFMTFRGTDNELCALKRGLIDHMDSTNLVITTYEVLMAKSSFLAHIPWHCVIIDEGHRLKNWKTQTSQVCRSLPCRHRILLTGTPVQNSLSELWSLLSFVSPGVFSSLENFQQWFALPPLPSVKLSSNCSEDDEHRADAEADQLLSEEEELLIIQRLHGVLRPFLLRRTKAQVLADLPPRKEVVVWVPLSCWQKAHYRHGLRKVHQAESRRVRCRQRGSTKASVSSGLFLRKAVNHPYHFLGSQAASTRSKEELVRASGKFEFLDRFLPRLLALDHKVLIFAQMATSLDLLEGLLQARGIAYVRIDGRKTLRQRAGAVASLKNLPNVGVMLLTTRAGGLGLNLQVADTVILFDTDWNPQADLQATDRAYRIGQQKPVLVVRLMTPTALDRGLHERSSRKLDMERKVIGAGNFTQESGVSDSQRQKLLDRLVREARHPANAGSEDGLRPSSFEEVNRLMSRSEAEEAAFRDADKELLGFEPMQERVESVLERAGRLVSASEVDPACRGTISRVAPGFRAEAVSAAKRGRRVV
eukprot:TRINITY_DN37405_c0_g1_i2.p1 TRINITY_DN37405_c0_g1~~TRINITY_DN37405_c0_g1_i2.p1  ORF type:complete len:789 (+),score=170.79 TRINITY_DN37405_c0_g1_i2:75-2441(+)